MKRFRMAKIASSCSDYNPSIGCAIYRGNKLVSIGFNKKKSHPKLANSDRFYSLHAEMSALLNAKQDVSGCTMYVYREFRGNGKPALAKPCTNCMPSIIEAKISRVVYTDNTNELGYSIIKLTNNLA